MRTARLKMRGKPCYYHLFNRISGYPGEFPFSDVNKEKIFSILGEIGNYFLVEPIAATAMGNHWHLVCYAPAPDELPDNETIAARHNAYYGERQPPLEANDAERCRKVGEEMIDISRYIGIFQQRFSAYFNRVHGRRGYLWADRFKNTLLDERGSLWSCVKYIELNGVRAGLVDEPADYRFCSWGRYCGSGRHPFQDYFLNHLRRCIVGQRAETMTDQDLFSHFRVELARTLAHERRLDDEKVEAALEQAAKPESMQVRFLRRTRHWTDGAIIGTKTFVQQAAAQFFTAERLKGRQLSRGTDAAGVLLYCFRRLRQDSS